MRVRVSFTVEVDQEAWANAYGIDKQQVRHDVNAYIYHGFLSYLVDNGLGPDPYEEG